MDRRFPRGRDEGSALVAVAVLGVIAMAVWALAFRATMDLIRIERFTVNREKRDDSVTRAAAAAATLLRTGPPPTDPYTCVFSIDGDESVYKCTVTYESAGSPLLWNIDAVNSTSEDIASLPAAPDDFGE